MYKQKKEINSALLTEGKEIFKIINRKKRKYKIVNKIN